MKDWRWWVYAVLVAGLFVPAGVLTFIRIFNPGSDLSIKLVAFTPLAIPLYAVAVLLLLGGGLRRGVTRAPYLMPAALALLGILLHLWWFSPQFTGTQPEAKPGGERTVVMTANLKLGQGDALQLVRRASDLDVDILVVNEITPAALATMEGGGISELFPFRAGDAAEGPRGTILFAREEVSLVSDLKTAFRGFTATVGDLSVMAVHPSPPTRADQWRRDHATLLEAAKTQRPDVIAGDFNATADHVPMRELDDAGFHDSAQLANKPFLATWPMEGNAPLTVFPPLVAIDHVLVTNDWVVTKTGTVDLADTDHRSVVTVFAPAA